MVTSAPDEVHQVITVPDQEKQMPTVKPCPTPSAADKRKYHDNKCIHTSNSTANEQGHYHVNEQLHDALVIQTREDTMATLCVELGLITKSADFEKYKRSLIQAEIKRKFETASVSTTVMQEVMDCPCATPHSKVSTLITPPLSVYQPVRRHIPSPASLIAMDTSSEDIRTWRKLANSDFTGIGKLSTCTHIPPPFAVSSNAASSIMIDFWKGYTNNYQPHKNISGQSDSENSLIHTLKENVANLKDKNCKQQEELEKERKKVKELEKNLCKFQHDIKEQQVRNSFQLKRIEKQIQSMETTYKTQLSVAEGKCRTANELHRIEKEKDQELIQKSNIRTALISKEKAELEEKNSHLQNEVDALKQTNQKQQNDLSDLKDNFEVTNDAMRELTLAKEMSHKMASILEGDISMAHIEMRAKDREIDDWKTKHESMVEALSKFKQDSKEFENILAERDRQLHDAIKRESDANMNCNQLDERLQKLQKVKSKAKTIITSLRTKLTGMQQCNSDLREEVEEFKEREEKRVEELQEEKCKIKESEQKLKREVLDSQLKVREISRKMADLEATKFTLQSEVDSLEKKKTMSDLKIENCKQLATDAKRTENELRARVDQLQDHIRVVRNMNKFLQQDKDELVKNKSLLECQLSQAQHEKDARYEILERKMAYSMSEKSTLQELVEKQSSELISVRFALKEAEEKTNQHELSGERKDSTITALKHELQQLKEEKNKDGKSGNDGGFIKQEKAYQSKLSQMQTKLKDLTKSVTESQQKFEALFEENQTLIKDLKQAHEDKMDAVEQLKSNTSNGAAYTDTSEDQQEM
ncbi:hypothetical protein BSL78_01011 [Apostichopus japonicus]|uniref:Uncharacterized protein n=1 Tax=Stichopus japonicus TaxID=307972 RepID=A0A2G8LP97_STIJA|nr:hypothetical protein BSL78_01011 [Apostichopus japonicus]